MPEEITYVSYFTKNQERKKDKLDCCNYIREPKKLKVQLLAKEAWAVGATLCFGPGQLVTSSFAGESAACPPSETTIPANPHGHRQFYGYMGYNHSDCAGAVSKAPLFSASSSSCFAAMATSCAILSIIYSLLKTPRPPPPPPPPPPPRGFLSES